MDAWLKHSGMCVIGRLHTTGSRGRISLVCIVLKSKAERDTQLIAENLTQTEHCINFKKISEEGFAYEDK